MLLFKTILNKSLFSFGKLVVRNLNTEIKRKVNPHSKISIQCPFSVTIQPLDYAMNMDNDHIFIKLTNNTDVQPTVTCEVNETDVTVTGCIDQLKENYNANGIHCYIEAPITSDIITNVSHHADLHVIKFSNENIIIKNSGSGNVVLQDCKSNNISVESDGGDISAEGLLLAQTINITTNKLGNIRTHRLQGTTANINTFAGDIETESCYCDYSTFTSQSGNMRLKNVHMNCVVNGEQLNSLLITGFDGTLTTKIQTSKSSNIQLSQINGDSSLIFKENSGCPVKLQLSRNVQDNCQLYVNAAYLKIGENLTTLQMCEVNNPNTSKNNVADHTNFQVEITCPNSELEILESSWAEAFLSSRLTQK